MALPAIAAAAAKGGGGREKPKAMGTEGVFMLSLAALLWFINIIIGILDFVFGVGIILGPIVNIPGTLLIGGWLWLRTGKFPLKKGVGPLITSSIPLAKFIPWWVIAVATSLDWKGDSAQEQPQEGERAQQKQPQQAQQPA